MAGENPSTGGESSYLFFFLGNEEIKVLVNDHQWKVNYVDRTSQHTGEIGERQNQIPINVEGSGTLELPDRAALNLMNTVVRDEIARNPRKQLAIVEDVDLPDGAVQYVFSRCRIKMEFQNPGQTDTLKIPFTYFCDIKDAEIPDLS